MKKYGKKYRAQLEKIGAKNSEHSLEDAIKLVQDSSVTKFDATVEIHIRTGCDPKHADQLVRATVILPHGTGKTKKIAVFAEEAKQKEAKSAGADVVGGEELIDEVGKGNIDFEIAIATPEMMKSLAKVAKILGPKGLMPSPKSGTVTDEIAKTIEELKGGKIEFKTDKQGIIHSILGKVSFGAEKLQENAKEFMRAIKEAKPTGLKANYLLSITVTTTMGPGVKVSLSDALS